MPQSTLTFRVDEELKERFSAAAKSQDRSSAQLLRDFMREFVSKQQRESHRDAWFQEQVKIGLEAADAGQTVSAQDVEAEARAWREAMQRRMGDSDT